MITAAPKPAPPAQPSSAQRVVELADAGGAKGNQLQRGEAANQVDSTARRSWRGVCGVCAVCAMCKGVCVWCVCVCVCVCWFRPGVRSCSELFPAFSPGVKNETKRATRGNWVGRAKTKVGKQRASWVGEMVWGSETKRFEKRLGAFLSFSQLFSAFLSFSYCAGHLK